MKRLEYRVERRLTDDELQAVLDGITDADIPQVALARAFTVLDMLLADVGLTMAGLAQADMPVDGAKLCIPADQWLKICQALMDWPAQQVSDVGKVNLGITWMNQGPSAFTEQPS